MKNKPIASLSLDLDNQWSYMKTHGDEGWDKFPSYLDTVVPRFIDVLGELEVKITVFVVGQDAAIEENHGALQQIPAAGHHVGNHSFHHEPWLHQYSDAQLEEEFDRAEEAIRCATGCTTKGFRGPGFSFSPAVLNLLARRGYQYDASTFPTFLGPLARAYYFMTSDLPPEERKTRKQLFGKFSEGLRPLKPYNWQLESGSLLEIPVTTMPLFKTPFHLSYILYLGMFSRTLALAYWGTALQLCRMAGVTPSVLLHPLDFMGCDDTRALDFFPAMQKPSSEKVALVRDALKMYSRYWAVGPMEDHATYLTDLNLKNRSPS